MLYVCLTRRRSAVRLQVVTMSLPELLVHVEIYYLMLLALPRSCVPLLMCPFSGPLYVYLLHEKRLALRSCRSSRVLEVVHLSWQAVWEDHCHRVVADQPSDGLVVVTGPYVHVWHRSSGSWLVSLSEVHGGHTSVCVSQSMCHRRGPIGHASTA